MFKKQGDFGAFEKIKPENVPDTFDSPKVI
jgi:hypothetical protein